MIRILLADHHPTPLWALRTMVEEEPECELVGEATDMDSLRKLSQENHPHLILIDTELPGGRIEEVIHELHLCKPKPVVIVMSSDAEQARVMLKAGADAFVSKSDRADWLLQVFRKYTAPQPKDLTNSTKEKGARKS